jgi:hypothetical protein
MTWPLWAWVVLLATSSHAFNATDLDPGDYIAELLIHSLPTNGTLFNTTDGTTVGAPLNNSAALPYVVPVGTDGVARVLYRSRYADAAQSEDLVQLTDALWYSVRDSFGVPSAEQAVLSLVIVNALEADALTSTATEDLFSVIFLTGRDQANLSAAPLFVITSLPQIGALYLTHNLTAALTNTSLPLRLPGDNVTYLGADNGFGASYASFQFYALGRDLVRRSPLATQTLDVTAVNDNFNVSYPTTRTLVPKGAAYRFRVAITDPDSPLSTFGARLEVPLTSFATTIALRPFPSGSFAPNLTFVTGTGAADPRVEFTGTRDDVNYALSIVSVTRITAGDENVTVTITDGTFVQTFQVKAIFQDSTSGSDTTAVLKWPYLVLAYAGIALLGLACVYYLLTPVRVAVARLIECLRGAGTAAGEATKDAAEKARGAYSRLKLLA